MGDLIEISTVPQGSIVFYKVSSGGLKVDIKGREGAVIALAKKLAKDCPDCDFSIVLGHYEKSWIKGRHKSVVKNTPNLLSSNEYRSFSILWDSQSISIRRAGENDPIICYNNAVKPLNYVSFAVKGGSPINWRFELPPEIPRPQLKSLIGGEPKWVTVGNQLPHGALVGGYENGSLYIIRATHRHSLTPGKFVPSEGVGYISWGGAAHEKEDFEVLVGYNCAWVPSSESLIPVGAVAGGHSEDNTRETLYIGRAKQGDHIIPGKVQPSHRVCYVPYEGRECAHRDYEILVSFEINKKASNKIFYSMDDIPVDTPDLSESDGE